MKVTNTLGLPQYESDKDLFIIEDLNKAFKKIDDSIYEMQTSVNNSVRDFSLAVNQFNLKIEAINRELTFLKNGTK